MPGAVNQCTWLRVKRRGSDGVADLPNTACLRQPPPPSRSRVGRTAVGGGWPPTLPMATAPTANNVNSTAVSDAVCPLHKHRPPLTNSSKSFGPRERQGPTQTRYPLDNLSRKEKMNAHPRTQSSGSGETHHGDLGKVEQRLPSHLPPALIQRPPWEIPVIVHHHKVKRAGPIRRLGGLDEPIEPRILGPVDHGLVKAPGGSDCTEVGVRRSGGVEDLGRDSGEPLASPRPVGAAAAAPFVVWPAASHRPQKGQTSCE